MKTFTSKNLKRPLGAERSIFLISLIMFAVVVTDVSDVSARPAGDYDRSGPRRDDLGDVIEQFNLPYANNAGMAWDGELIWGSCRTGQRRLYSMNPENFEVVDRYDLNISDAIGMTWDPVDGVFWICEHQNDNSIAHLYDREGEHVGEIELPRGGHHGLAWDGEFFYSNSENSQNDQRIFRLNRQGEIVDRGPNLAAVINHGRAVSIEYVPAHGENRFWVMSVGYISLVEVDFENDEAEVLEEFRSNNTDYPHQGITHDGFNLWAGGTWREQRGFIYDDGIEERYGVLEISRDFIDFGPVPVDEENELVLRLYNRAEGEEDIYLLSFEIAVVDEDIDWLSFDQDAGDIEAGDSLDVTFTADCTDLEIGEYEGAVLLTCNDPDRRNVEIGIHLQVVEGFGRLSGVVYDAENDEPISDAILYVDYFGFADTTDEDGEYSFDEIPAWTYDLRVTHSDYQPFWHRDLEIGADEDIELNFELVYAEFNADPDRIVRSMQTDEELALPLTISNGGNAPLTWSVERVFPEDNEADPWTVRFEEDLEEVVDDNQLNGVVYVDGHFYVSGGNRGQDDNLIYMFNSEGELVDRFAQRNQSRYGMRDLTFDGELIWGADGDIIYGYNTQGEFVTSIEGDAGSYRSLAWDPDNEVFWSADITSDAWATDLDGNVVETIELPGEIRTYGMAYWHDDPDGYRLYTFARGGENVIHIYKINIETAEIMLAAEVQLEESGRPGGIFITNMYDVYSWVLIGMVQNSDRLTIWHLAAREDWLRVEPAEGVIEAGEGEELAVTLNSLGYPEDTELNVNLLFTHDGRGGSDEVPVQLSVTGEGGLAQRVLSFNTGWNMVSLNIQPDVDDMRQVFAPLVEENILIMVKDGQGRFYVPDFDFNDLRPWAGMEGYQVKVTQDAELSVEGEVIPWDSEIPLGEGWNLISYLPRQPVDAIIALQNIEENLNIVKDGTGHFYLPAWDFSNIGSMDEGNGYLVNVTEDVDLVYSLEEAAARMPEQKLSPVDLKWINEITKSESSFSLLLLTEGFTPGTRIEARTTAGITAGRGIVGADGRCGMALWGESSQAGEGGLESPPPNTGFHENDDLTIYPGNIERALQANPYALDWLEGESKTWEADGWGVARLIKGAPVPVKFGIKTAYPNPFNGQLRVEFALEKSGLASLNVLDLTGREVARLIADELSAGSHFLIWRADQLASGVYILKLTREGHEHSIKVVLVR